MSSISAADKEPEKALAELIKSFLRRLDVILVIGLLVVAGLFTFNIISKNFTETESSFFSNEEMIQMLSKDAKRIDLFVQSAHKVPKEIATILSLQKLSKEEIEIIQQSILLNSPELFGTAVAFEPYYFDEGAFWSSSYVFRKDGNVYYSTLDDPEYDYFSKDWYQLPEIIQQPTWMEPYFDEGGGGAFMTTYSVPFFSFDGVKETFAGIVTVDVSIEWLTNFITANKKLPNNGFIILVSEGGTIISSPNKEWLVNHTIFTLSISLEIPELREIGRALQKGESGVKRVKSPLNEKVFNVFYASVSANKWGILYIIPDDYTKQLLN